jgi:hypothetical protein
MRSILVIDDEFAERWQPVSRQAKAPVVLFTGPRCLTDIEPSSGPGVTAILPKPFDPMTSVPPIADAPGWS